MTVKNMNQSSDTLESMGMTQAEIEAILAELRMGYGLDQEEL